MGSGSLIDRFMICARWRLKALPWWGFERKKNPGVPIRAIFNSEFAVLDAICDEEVLGVDMAGSPSARSTFVPFQKNCTLIVLIHQVVFHVVIIQEI